MAHFPSALAEFQRGESRLVYARYRSGEPGLFMLADGTAEEQRQYTKTELLCPVGGCPTPEFTTVDRSRSGRRDGFRHLVGNFSHAPESLFHLEAKAQLARYIRARHPETRVVEEQASNAECERIADVMVTWPDGRRVALEVQYSPLSTDDWKIRHDSYAAQGITDIWLFGHTGPQMNAAGLQVTFTSVQREVAKLGRPVLWFNPIALAIATATTKVTWSGEESEILSTDWRGTLTMNPLAEFRLDHTQFVSRRIAELAEAGARYRQFLTHEKERKAKDLVAAKAGAVRSHQINARRVAEAQDWKAGRRTAMLRVWLDSTSGRTAAERFGGEVPSWLNVDTKADIQVPNQVWQWHLFTTYVDPLPDRGWVRRDHAWKALETEFELGLSDTELKQMVTVWFDALSRARILHRTQVRRRGTPVVKYWKIRQRDARPDAQPDVAAQAGEEVEAVERQPVALNSATLSPQESAECGKCGLTVAPPFARTGYHMACAPFYRGYL